WQEHLLEMSDFYVESEPQSMEDLKAVKNNLVDEVDVLEQGYYDSTSTIREYVLKIALLLAILNISQVNNLKRRLNSGALSVTSLWFISEEEMLPELFLNKDLVGSKNYDTLELGNSRFRKWFDN